MKCSSTGAADGYKNKKRDLRLLKEMVLHVFLQFLRVYLYCVQQNRHILRRLKVRSLLYFITYTIWEMFVWRYFVGCFKCRISALPSCTAHIQMRVQAWSILYIHYGPLVVDKLSDKVSINYMLIIVSQKLKESVLYFTFSMSSSSTSSTVPSCSSLIFTLPSGRVPFSVFTTVAMRGEKD